MRVGWHRVVFSLALLAASASGCGPSDESLDRTVDDGAPLPRRPGALVIDACPMDSFHRAQLAAPSTRAVIDEVILLCLYARDSGAVGPDAPETSQWLRDDIAATRAAGYRVTLGLTVGESNLDWYTPTRATDALLSSSWRAQVVEQVSGWASQVDGLDVALPSPVENRARPGVDALVTGLAQAVRPKTALGLFAPPSLIRPSDLEGGDAYDLTALAPQLDRIRVMTLDYSCCDLPGGPSTDPGWAVDAARFAAQLAPGVPLHVTLPLFGTDFSPLGARSVTYLEAMGLATYHRADIQRGPTGAPFFGYTDAAGQAHALWFDDTFSIRLALGAWSTALPPSMGVLYYGLGAEEPGLWSALARSQP